MTSDSSKPVRPSTRAIPLADELPARLAAKLDDVGLLLDAIVAAVAKGAACAPLLADLHAAALRDERVEDLALAYERLAQERRLKLLPGAGQAEILYGAAVFFEEAFGDTHGAIAYLEKVLAAYPAHVDAFERMDRLLSETGDAARRADVYALVAPHRGDTAVQLELLQRAAALLEVAGERGARAVRVHQQIVKLAPDDVGARLALAGQLLAAGRGADAARLLEQGLPNLAEGDVVRLRGRLLELYADTLGEPERATPHVEEVLRRDPSHAGARAVAERLLGHRPVAGRAAAALELVHRAEGRPLDAAAMLAVQVEHTYGPRRVEVQRRLAALRLDELGDPEGARPLLEAVVRADPTDEEARRRFREVSESLDRSAEAAPVLARAAASTRDVALRARIGLEVGELYLSLGDSRRARGAFEGALASASDVGTELAAARALLTMHDARTGDRRARAAALERVARLETDAEARTDAVVQLAATYEELGDARAATAALQGLLGGAAEPLALEALDRLHRAAGDEVALAEVLERRAGRSEAPGEARAFSFESADLRSRGLPVDEAIALWQGFVERFGPSHDALARLVELLGVTDRWSELAATLEADAALGDAEVRSARFGELAALRLARLGDPGGALGAAEQAVASGASAGVVETLERLLQAPAESERAAELLEPLVRATGDEGVLLRLLLLRAASAPTPRARLAAYDEALGRLPPESPPERAVAIAVGALREALASLPDAVAPWLARLVAHAVDPATRASALASIVGGASLSERGALVVVECALAAHLAAGQRSDAVTLLERALAVGDAALPLLARLEPALEGATVDERLRVFRAARAAARDPGARRALAETIARLELEGLGDAAASAETWRGVVRESVLDEEAWDALLAAVEAAGDGAVLVDELERAAAATAGARRIGLLSRAARLARARGATERALAAWDAAVAEPEADAATLEEAEGVARELGHAPTLRALYARRADRADAPAIAAEWLVALADAELLDGDGAAALATLRRAAALADLDPEALELGCAVRERILERTPRDAAVAERLAKGWLRAGRLERVPSAYRLWIDALDDDREIVERVLELEPIARSAGADDELLLLLDRVIARDSAAVRASRVALQTARARALAATPEGVDEAAALYRRVLASEGDAPEVVAAFAELLSTSAPTAQRLDDARFLFGRRMAVARGVERDRIEDELAAWLADHGGADEALALVEGRLSSTGAREPGVLRVLRMAVAEPATRVRAAALLDAAVDHGVDLDEAVASLRALLATPSDDRELAGARPRWTARLLALVADRPEDAFAIALDALAEAPLADEVWDRAEALVRVLERPEPLAAAYVRALERATDAVAAEAIGRRAVDFHHEWFDDEQRDTALLERVLHVAPTAEWAFDRLKVAYDSAERYDDLFALYDRMIAVAPGAEARVAMLDEAAQAAGDFSATPARAIGYLEQIHALQPADARVTSTLERLYERHERHRALIDLLGERLGRDGDAEVAATRLRIADLWLRDADGVSAALATLEPLVEVGLATEAMVPLLERILERTDADATPTVRHRAATLLAGRYRASGATRDQVRVLTVALEAKVDVPEAIARRRELYALRLDDLGDRSGAFDEAAALLGLAPDDGETRERLERLASELGLHQAHADVLASAADACAAPTVSAGLWVAAAAILRERLGKPAVAIELLARALDAAPREAPVALEAARALDAALDAEGRVAERCTVLERLAELETEPAARRRALLDVAALAAGPLGDRERAARSLRAALASDPDDAEALDACIDALDAPGHAIERRSWLARRAERGRGSAEALRDWMTIARLCGELGADDETISTLLHVRRVFGPDPATRVMLEGLLERTGRFAEWVALLGAEAERAAGIDEQAAWLVRAGEVSRDRLSDATAARDAFVEALRRDATSAAARAGLLSLLAVADQRAPILDALAAFARVDLLADAGEASVAAGDDDTARAAALAILTLAVHAAWPPGSDDAEASPGREAAWAVETVVRLALARGDAAEAVEAALAASRLPFAPERKRCLLDEAASLAADRMGDADRAIALYREMFAEQPADACALAAAGRYGALLDRRGLDAELVALWEGQAAAHEALGEADHAAGFWARAGGLAESRLGDAARAIRSFSAGARLGGIVSLEAVARLALAEGHLDLAADALERLADRAAPHAVLGHTLRLADTWVAVGRVDDARVRLERAYEASPSAEVRDRLVALYRRQGAMGDLAGLLAREARAEADPRARAQLLVEAAAIYTEACADPARAVPLLEAAWSDDGEAIGSLFALVAALLACGRTEQAAAHLAERLERYGTRRPKERALVHLALAEARRALGERAPALAELDAAAKIDPTNAAVLLELATLAFEENQLERAAKTYRALLLLLRRPRADALVGRAEVLLSLAAIAARQSETKRADELLDSAFDAARETPRELERLIGALRSHGRFDLLERALDEAIDRAADAPRAVAWLAERVALWDEGASRTDEAARALVARARALLSGLAAADPAAAAALDALEAIFTRLGATDARTEILERRVAALDAAAGPGAVELLLAWATLRLEAPGGVADGLDRLRQACDAGLALPRAAEVLAHALARAPHDAALAVEAERVARAAGDDRLLLDALGALSAHREVDPREIVELARRVGDPAREEQALRAIVEGAGVALEPAERAWAAAELAELCVARGDLEGAVACKERIAADSPPAEACAALREAAALARDALGDPGRAVRAYERCLAIEPADRDAWGPLLELHRVLGDEPARLALLATVVALLDASDERSRLRVELSSSLALDPARLDEAIAVLRDEVADDPGAAEAAASLAALLERRGHLRELADLLGGQLERARVVCDAAAVVELALRLGALHERVGEPALAADTFAIALEWAPSSAVAASALERLRGVRHESPTLDADALLDDWTDGEGEPEPIELDLDPLDGVSGAPEPTSELELEVVSDEREPTSELELEVVSDEREPTPGLELEVVSDEPELTPGLELEIVADDTPGTASVAARPDADAARAWYERARESVALGADDEALADLERAFELGAGAYVAELVSAYERAIDRSRGERERDLRLRLADVLVRSGALAAARGHLTEWLRREPDDALALDALARLEGSRAALARTLAATASRASDEARVALLSRAGALCLVDGEDAALALPWLEEAYALAGGGLEATLLYVRALAAVDRGPEARRLLEDLVTAGGSLPPHDLARVHAELSRVALAEGDLDVALDALSIGWQLDPADADLAMSLGHLARDLDQRELAVRAFESVSEAPAAGPGEHEGTPLTTRALSLVELAELAAAEGDASRAHELAGRALEDDPALDRARELIEQLDE